MGIASKGALSFSAGDGTPKEEAAVHADLHIVAACAQRIITVDKIRYACGSAFPWRVALPCRCAAAWKRRPACLLSRLAIAAGRPLLTSSPSFIYLSRHVFLCCSCCSLRAWPTCGRSCGPRRACPRCGSVCGRGCFACSCGRCAFGCRCACTCTCSGGWWCCCSARSLCCTACRSHAGCGA
jgi:hypothetical protein